MKRADLVRQINGLASDAGLVATWAHGAKHDKVTVGARTTTVPRHREIGDRLASEILKQLHLPR